MTASDDLADEFITVAVLLALYEAGLQRTMRGLLADLHNDIRLVLLNAGIDDVRSPATKMARAEKAIEKITQLIRDAYSELGRRLTREMKALAPIIYEAEIQAMNRALEGDPIESKLSTSDFRRLIASALVLGSPLEDWIRGQSIQLQQQVASQIRLGVIAKENAQATTKRLLGRSTGRRVIETADGTKKTVPVHRGGTLEASRRASDTVSRGAAQTAANEAAKALYEQETAQIEGMQALAVLDGRTTLLCIGRAGAIWDLDGNPLPGSPWPNPFPGAPPWHWNCRTLIIPFVGKPAKDITYEDWLRTKPKSFQRKVLGPARWKLWNAGKLNAADLTDVTGRTLTLDELRTEFAPSTN